MATTNDPNFFRNDDVTFGSVKLSNSTSQIKTPGATFTLSTVGGTLRSTGSSQPVNTPDFASTISVDPTLGDVVRVNGVSTTSATCTLNLSAAPAAGQPLTLILNASSSGTVTYTLGTNFRSAGTVASTASTSSMVQFISDGSKFLEVARNVAQA